MPQTVQSEVGAAATEFRKIFAEHIRLAQGIDEKGEQYIGVMVSSREKLSVLSPQFGKFPVRVKIRDEEYRTRLAGAMEAHERFRQTYLPTPPKDDDKAKNTDATKVDTIETADLGKDNKIKAPPKPEVPNSAVNLDDWEGTKFSFVVYKKPEQVIEPPLPAEFEGFVVKTELIDNKA